VNRIITLLNTGRAAGAFLLVFGLVSTGAPAAAHNVAYEEGFKAMTMRDDLVRRSADIHWPAGFEPENADLFAHNEALINASCERIWKHLVDAKQWPTWYPNSKDVQIQGGAPVLRDGTIFRWTTFDLAIESEVHEYVPNRRLSWYGYAPGAKPSFYHSWYLEPKGALCRVVMDEAGIGADAASLRQSDETLMHRGHDLWLATLKWVAEAK
jgi:uncharacterized protein YndB with AHSA1/START domain